MKFVLSFTNSDVFDLSEYTYENILNRQKIGYWFISYCLPEADENDNGNCLDELVLKKLSIMMNGLVNVATINCNYEKNLCAWLKPSSPNLFYKELPTKMNQKIDNIEQTKIESSSYKEIAQKLLSFLPDVNLLNGEKLEVYLKES